MAQNAREHTPLSVAVAATVRAERAALGLTREEVSARSGVPVSTLRRIETQERVATVSQLGGVARALGLRLSDLLLRAESRMEDARAVPIEAEVADLVLQADLEDEPSPTYHPCG